MKKTMSLNFKLVTGGILVVLIPLLVVGVFSAWKSSEALSDIAENQAEHIAKNVAGIVNMALSEEMKLIAGLAVDPAIMEAASGKTDGATHRLTAMMRKIGHDYEAAASLWRGTLLQHGHIVPAGGGRLFCTAPHKIR